jgi:hypothetical protein
MTDMEAELERLSVLEQDWDGNGAEPPNITALDEARAILARLRMVGFFPYRVSASAEGGVGICFRNGKRYADLECFNTGEVIGITSDGEGQIEPFEVSRNYEDQTAAIDRIRSFVAG